MSKDSLSNLLDVHRSHGHADATQLQGTRLTALLFTRNLTSITASSEKVGDERDGASKSEEGEQKGRRVLLWGIKGNG